MYDIDLGYSWNPYFDGNFSMKKAKERFKKYIG